LAKKNYTSQSNTVLIITGTLFAGLIIGYFAIPEFQNFVQEAYRILTSENEQKISDWVSQFGIWGPVFIIVAVVGQMFLIVVNVVLLVLVAVLAYGPWWGSLLGVFSICVASTVGYWIGRSLGTYTVYKLIGEKTERRVEKYAKRYGYFAVVFARLSPFLSNDAISFVAGLIRMNYWKFMLATLTGIIPLTVFIAWMSKDMERLKNGLIWVSIITIVAFIAYIIYDKVGKSDENQFQV
jgi:uncharacterized membrane protein YdjX (TVP38/TMEM64 family)